MDRDPVKKRKEWSEAWTKKMIEIWEERIDHFPVKDTGALFDSLKNDDLTADSQFLVFKIQQSFLEYGLWQDLGTGREVPIGNGGDIGREKKRKRRRWFSTKYYRSVFNLRRFYAESLGEDFVNFFASLDADKLRHNSPYYRRKGLS